MSDVRTQSHSSCAQGLALGTAHGLVYIQVQHLDDRNAQSEVVCSFLADLLERANIAKVLWISASQLHSLLRTTHGPICSVFDVKVRLNLCLRLTLLLQAKLTYQRLS